MGSRDQATAVGAGAIALWATLALLTAASGTAPPFEMAGMTFLIGGAVGLIYATARAKLSSLAQPWRVWAVGVGGLFGYHALYFAALRAAPPAQASLVAYLWPLLIVLMSAALPGEKLLLKHIAGAVLGFCGAALLIGAKGGAPSVGLVLALGCAFVWSSYSLASRLLRETPTEPWRGFASRPRRWRGFAISCSKRRSGQPTAPRSPPSRRWASARWGWRSIFGTMASSTATFAFSASAPMRPRRYRRSCWF